MAEDFQMAGPSQHPGGSALPGIPLGLERWGVNYGWEAPDISEERMLLMEQRGSAESDMYKTIREFWQEDARTQRELMRIQADIQLEMLSSFTDALTARMGANAQIGAARYGFESEKLANAQLKVEELRDMQKAPPEAREAISQLVQQAKVNGAPPDQQSVANVIMGVNDAQIMDVLDTLQNQGVDVAGLFRDKDIQVNGGTVNAGQWLEGKVQRGQLARDQNSTMQNQVLHDAFSLANGVAIGVGMGNWEEMLADQSRAAQEMSTRRPPSPPPDFMAPPQMKQAWLDQTFGKGAYTVSQDGTTVVDFAGNQKSYLNASAELMEAAFPPELRQRLQSFQRDIAVYDQRIGDLEQTVISPFRRRKQETMQSQAFQDWMAKEGYQDPEQAYKIGMAEARKRYRETRQQDRWLARDKRRHHRAEEKGLIEPAGGPEVAMGSDRVAAQRLGNGPPDGMAMLQQAPGGAEEESFVGSDIEFGNAEAEVQEVPNEEDIVEGSGGYKYRRNADGSVTIMEAPGGRGVGTTLSEGPAYDAIMKEIGQVPQAEPEPPAFHSMRPGAVKPSGESASAQRMVPAHLKGRGMSDQQVSENLGLGVTPQQMSQVLDPLPASTPPGIGDDIEFKSAASEVQDVTPTQIDPTKSPSSEALPHRILSALRKRKQQRGLTQ